MGVVNGGKMVKQRAKLYSTKTVNYLLLSMQ